MGDDRELVYSSETGWQAPAQRRDAKPATGKRAMPDDGIIRIARERRRGSVMTLVHGLSASELAETGKTLKRLCGTGGTTKNGIVEIQGDHREKIAAWFAGQGRVAKLAGG
ncbi:MAG TPA: translation initiation factor [Candidatus Baltobacteraceae bacterium]|nr:translation initiation factor [Candidatus Baltobacteraceae bacterium]